MENYINNQYIGLYKPILWVNMITEKQLKIFKVFASKPFNEFTRNQIKKDSEVKSNNFLALTINHLKKEEVILEKKIGKSGLLTLNMNNDLTYYYIAINNNRISNTVKKTLSILKDELNEIITFYSIVIFGSYAINKQKQSSDLDIAIFIEEKNKYIQAIVNSVKLKSLIDIDVHIIPKEEMIEMLTNNEENLGKQIARKHIAVHNNQIFYDIVRQGMKHGFRI